MIENHTTIKVVNEFDKCYSEKAISICPFLSKLSIHVYTVEQYVNEKEKEQLVDIDWDNSPLAFGINKTACSISAVIVIDEDYCNRLELSDDELLASIAHEVGHIIFFFLTNKSMYSNSIEEIKADKYALNMGLGIPLVAAIRKMKDSGTHDHNMLRQLELRIGYLERMLG